MSNKPDYLMYAVLKDGIVIDGGFEGEDGKVFTIKPPNQLFYTKEDGYDFIEVKEQHGFIKLGMKYKDNQFLEQKEQNA